MRRAIRNANDNMTPEQTRTALEYLYVYDWLQCMKLMQISTYVHNYEWELESSRYDSNYKMTTVHDWEEGDRQWHR